MELVILHSLKIEHEELRNTLRKGAKENGELGAAARAVADLMHQHFLKEEKYALPPLGLLGDLSRGATVSSATDVPVLTDRLKADLPQMLAEQRSIVAALERLSAPMLSAPASLQLSQQGRASSCPCR